MARAVTAPELAAIEAAHRAHALKVEVEDSAGAWRELTAIGGRSWMHEIRIRKDVDHRIAELRGSVWRNRESGENLSPLHTTSSLAGYLDAGRQVRVWAGIEVQGSVPTPDKLLFHGRFRTIDPSGDRIQFDAMDLMSAAVVRRMVETPTEYGTEDGRPIQDVIQDLLDDWSDGVTVTVEPGSGILTTPFLIKPRYRQEAAGLYEALQALQNLIGYVFEYRWSDAAGGFLWTFMEPPRNASAIDWTFPASRTLGVREVRISDEDVRNVWKGFWTTDAGARAEHSIEDTASIDRYGRRPAQIQEADDSAINTLSEMDTMLSAALSDTKDPLADHARIVPFHWALQLGDLCRFEADGKRTSADQDWGCVGWEHVFQSGRQPTTAIRTRGRPTGQTKGWIKRTKIPRPPKEVTAGLTLLDFREVKRTQTDITYAWKLGTDLDESWIHDYQRDQPYTTDQWPGTTRAPDSVDSSREVEYTVAIPEAGKVGYFQVEGRRVGVSQADDMERVLIFPLNVASGTIFFAVCTVNQSDGSAKVTGWTTDRAKSIAHAANVGPAASTSGPSEAEAEAQGAGNDLGGLVTGFTSDFEINYGAGSVPHGEIIKGLLIAYVNEDGTGPDGTRTDHDDPVGFFGERIKIHQADGLAERIVLAEKLTDDSMAFGWDGSFSAPDWDTVQWTAATLVLADGTTHAVSSGDTGDIPDDSPRMIYWDRATPGAFQVTNDFDVATGQDKILMCVAVRASTGASSGQHAGFFPSVGQLGLNEDHLSPASVSTNILQANSVTAVKANIAFLSSLAADLGTVTAGTIEADVLIASEEFTAAIATFTGSMAVMAGDSNFTMVEIDRDFSGGRIKINTGAAAADFQITNDSAGALVFDKQAAGGAAEVVFAIPVQMQGALELDGALDHDGSSVGFYGAVPVAQQTVNGARDDPEAALKNLLAALNAMGAIIDGTTAT